METRTENSAAEPVISIPENADEEFHARLMRYRLAISLVDSMVAREVISLEESAILYTTIAEQHGLSSCSIFL